MGNKLNLSSEYPYNLIKAVKGTTSLELPVTSEERMKLGLQYVIATLDTQDQVFLNLRYAGKKSLQETAAYFAISEKDAEEKEKKIIRKLRQPTKWGYIQYGIEGYLRKRIGEVRNSAFHNGFTAGYHQGLADGKAGIFPGEISDSILDTPLESIGLSAKAYNALIRRNRERIRDIAHMKEEEILRLRNMGKKLAGEVAQRLQEYGVQNTEWDKFLL